jgi:hypothetical protein
MLEDILNKDPICRTFSERTYKRGCSPFCRTNASKDSIFTTLVYRKEREGKTHAIEQCEVLKGE